MKRIRTVVGIFKNSPPLSMFVLGSVLIVASMLLTYKYYTFNSDAVVIQNALLQGWVPFTGDTFFSNKDATFILQTPLYWLVSLFIEPGRRAMLVGGIGLALINFGLVYYSILHFLRVLKIKATWTSLSPVLLLGVFGFGLNILFIGTNFHTISVGLAFIFLTFVSKICRGELLKELGQSQFVVTLGAAALIGLSIVNDTYFMYFGVVPAALLALFYAVKKQVSLKRFAFVGAIIGAGILAAVFIWELLPHVGITTNRSVGQPNFAEFEMLGAFFANTVHSLSVMMGINFYGQPIIGVEALISLLGISVLVATAIGTVRIFRAFPKISPEATVLAVIFWLVIVAHAVSTYNANDVITYRYFVLIPFLAVAILAITIGSLNWRLNRVGAIVLGVVILIGVVVNGVSSIALERRATLGIKESQEANYSLINTLRHAGVKKGYGEYWHSHINSYLSGGDLSILPIGCLNNVTEPYFAFAGEKQFLEPADRSFYILSPFDPKAISTCPDPDVRRQFGEPTEILNVGPDTIFIYNYDIGTRLNLTDVKDIHLKNYK